ncbi:MAG: hypothetical protein JWN12_659 [Candidatus Saccharibacteria bacterium]|nr:hypothetical protein [Candidatus Saccharibacteria bacterium]
MNTRSQELTGGVRNLVRGLAESGSMMGTWNEQREQTVLLERSGSVDMLDFDTINAVFEAKRYRDNRHRLRTVYLARVAGSRELVLEELSEDLKVRLAKATVSASVAETVIKTDNMSTEPDNDGDPMEFLEEDGYRHTQSVEYRLNGNGEILECIRSDEYTQSGESVVDVRYSEPYRRGKLAVTLMTGEFIRDAPRFNESRKKVLERELAVDLVLLEHLDDYRNDAEMTALSRREHEGRIFAITAFVTRRADPIELLQIALS